MTVFVALLRAIKVGGTGMLAMKDLVALCEAEGFDNLQTYIQSGNVVFESSLSEGAVKAKLEAALAKALGKPADVMLRTVAELKAVLASNPFPNGDPARVIVQFASEQLEVGVLEAVVAPDGERVGLGGARGLHPLPGRSGPLEASAAPAEGRGHRAKPQYRREAFGDGAGARLRRFPGATGSVTSLANDIGSDSKAN